MKEREIFTAALNQGHSADRSAFLNGACGGDAALQQSVESLLVEHEQLGSFLESPSSAASLNRPISEGPGTKIGPYKLLQQIGEGGFGVVYMAEQQSPVRRKVALKIIKPGMDTKEVIARFESERQALALMDHANIAKVLDAGATESGRPYFVMELVKGIPITKFCDDNHLPPEERLTLFIQVCNALQHAHQKGIIHRDLKPSNVMVTMRDGCPVPKVIDFGVAKATSQTLTERTLFTAYGQMIGTPAYMSPEQAEMSCLDIDTRSDIYSLGVLLYELLTGTTPFEAKRLREAGFSEMQRIIRDEEPQKPSTRVSTLLRPALTSLSQQHGIDERRLRQHLRGELDWIIMKALDKDRERRYESASIFARDIRHYLSGEPVQACPPSTLYRFRKYSKKHRTSLVTVGVVLASLIAAAGVSTWQAIRATAAEGQAAANEQRAVANAAAAEQKEQEATKQRDETKALADKLQYTLYVAHMNWARHAWEEGAMEHFEELLAQHGPQAGATDLRGFEWHYLNRLGHGALLTLRGHGTRGVNGLAYSPDGKRLATASSDTTIKLWDAQAGREIRSIQAHTERVFGVAFSPDGARLASASQDKTAKVWDAETGRELVVFTGHTDEVNKVAYSPDGKRLASASDDTTVKVWDAQTGAELISFKGHASEVYHVAFSPDGKRVASADDDMTKVWDAETAQELLSIDEGGGKCSFSPDAGSAHQNLASASTLSR